MGDTENTKELSRARIIFRKTVSAFRVVCVGFLTLLLVVGVVFAAPFKVLIFILVFDLVAVFLSWRFQLAFWFCMSLIIAGFFVWLMAVDSDHEWIAYENQARAMQFNEQRCIDDAENAALIYEPILKQRDIISKPESAYFEFHKLDVNKPWSAQDYPDMAESLEVNGDCIATLLRAGQYKECRFPAASNLWGLDVLLKRQADMKCLARTLLNSANNDIGEGRSRKAFEKQIAALAMAHHNFQQRTVFEMSAGTIIEQMALADINYSIIDNPNNADQLRQVEEMLSRSAPDKLHEDWETVYASLELLTANTLDLSFEIAPDNNIRRSRQIGQTVNDRFRYRYHMSDWEKRVSKVGAICHWFMLPSSPEKLEKIVNKSFRKYDKLIDHNTPPGPIANTPKPSLRFNFKFASDYAAHYSASFYLPLHRQSVSRLNAHRATEILIAVRRFHDVNGRYPDSLGQLSDVLSDEAQTDPLNGSEYVYRLGGDSDFVFYSLGKNNVDDNGLSDYANSTDDRLYWPPSYEYVNSDEPTEKKISRKD